MVDHSLAETMQLGAYNCDEGCALGDGGPPVCGVDGTTYFNECLAACQDVGVEHAGPCASDPPRNAASFVAQGRVSRAEMDAFKEKGYRLVAKRTFGGMPSNEPENVSPPRDHENEDAKGKEHVGPSSDNGHRDSPSSVKLSMITREGLEYVAEVSVDYNAKGTEGSGGMMPPPEVRFTPPPYPYDPEPCSRKGRGKWLRWPWKSPFGASPKC